MPEHRAIKALIGEQVAVDCYDGVRAQGQLLNANRRSLWLVTADEDRFIPLAAISDLHVA